LPALHLQLRVLEASLRCYSRLGFEKSSLELLAQEAVIPLSELFPLFPSPEHVALQLYDWLAAELCSQAQDLPEGTISERFQAAIRKKLQLIEPHRAAFLALAGIAINPSSRAALFGPESERIRVRVQGVFELVIAGAVDAPETPDAALLRNLYLLHLLIILLWLQQPEALDRLLTLAQSLLDLRGFLGSDFPLLQQADQLFAEFLKQAPTPEPLAQQLLSKIFARRRVLAGVGAPGPAAFALHLPRVQHFLDTRRPLQLVLPAFPAKAPNPQKVLGSLPDMAERLALGSLLGLIEELKTLYPVGASLVICSDGHVFADVVGVSDAQVSAYRQELERLLENLKAPIRLFGLEDAFPDADFETARQQLLKHYASSDQEIEERARAHPAHRAQLDGIHRFMFEDQLARFPEKSRTSLRKQSYPIAIEVVRRSDAWGRLITAAFPDALRLSIHPQPDISDKIGIQLMPTEDAWLTPWHGAALYQKAVGFTLIKRAQAPEACVVMYQDRPDYLELP
jgi:pyoverdine/dityrosine biosynthesis protein Dit1/AcrR family transcriptional regulator